MLMRKTTETRTTSEKPICAADEEANAKAKKQRMNDEEKNDLILVEDEIYNIVLRPAVK